MKHDENSSNPSGNTPFEDIMQARISRRGVLKGNLAVAAGFLGGSFGSAALADKDDRGRAKRRDRRPLIGFQPVPVAAGLDPDYWPRISADYQFQTLIPWGDPLEPGGPEYVQVTPNDPNAGIDFADLAARQARQFWNRA